MLLPILLLIALISSLILTSSVLNTAPVTGRGQGTRVVAGDTTFCAGVYRPSECVVGGWRGISQIAAGTWHTVGLKSDGTVIAAGDNHFGECEVGGWTDLIQVAAGNFHTVGLKSDGTVVATGSCKLGRCDVGDWTDIIQVGAGEWITVGVKSDGTAVAAPHDEDSERCKVGAWRNIIQVGGGSQHTVGLRSDGTVVAAYGWLTTIPPGSGCFIATAAYGTPLAQEIRVLREFRDQCLLTKPLGQALVGLYDRVSPPIAEFITEHPGLKPLVRAGLFPAVAMSTVVVNTTPAGNTAILALLILISAALVVWGRKRTATSRAHL